MVLLDCLGLDWIVDLVDDEWDQSTSNSDVEEGGQIRSCRTLKTEKRLYMSQRALQHPPLYLSSPLLCLLSFKEWIHPTAAHLSSSFP